MLEPSSFTAGKTAFAFCCLFVCPPHTHISQVSSSASAGVGRTGTFIVIDAMLDMMNAERKVDVFGFVTRIRAQRCQMVQTDVSATTAAHGETSPHAATLCASLCLVLSVSQMQYVFIFQALLEHYLYGDTELEVTSLESHLAKLYAPSPGAGCSGLEAEFKVCEGICFKICIYLNTVGASV